MNAFAGAARQYQSVAVDARVEQASPRKLIGLLLNGAAQKLAEARGCIERGDIAGRGAALSRVLAILGELRASLDFEAGGEFARQLEALYDYLSRRVLLAGSRSDLTGLGEVGELLAEIRMAWQDMPVPADA